MGFEFVEMTSLLPAWRWWGGNKNNNNKKNPQTIKKNKNNEGKAGSNRYTSLRYFKRSRKM